MKTFKFIFLTMTFLAFMSQALATTANCKMLMAGNNVATDKVQAQDPERSAQHHSMGHDMGHTMDVNQHDMSAMNDAMSDCDPQNCDCNMLSCQSIVLLKGTLLTSVLPSSAAKTRGTATFIINNQYNSLYRPPINS